MTHEFYGVVNPDKSLCPKNAKEWLIFLLIMAVMAAGIAMFVVYAGHGKNSDSSWKSVAVMFIPVWGLLSGAVGGMLLRSKAHLIERKQRREQEMHERQARQQALYRS